MKLTTYLGLLFVFLLAGVSPAEARRGVDPHVTSGSSLVCPNCGGEMKIINFITEASIVRQILKHLNLWAERLSRDPPEWGLLNEDTVVVREPFEDGWGQYDGYNTPSYSA